MKNILITGTSSCLGKFLYKSMPNSVPLKRSNLIEHSKIHYPIIIHCAGSSEHQSENIILESEFLLKSILKISHDTIIFISTVDIYRDPTTIYCRAKLNCEEILKKHPHALILRSSMIIGPYMRPNHITKLKYGQNIGLSRWSTFNYISVNGFLRALNSDKFLTAKGTFDFVSTNNIKVNEVKKMLKSNSKTGSYKYISPINYQNPIYTHFPNLIFNSEHAIKEMIDA